MPLPLIPGRKYRNANSLYYSGHYIPAGTVLTLVDSHEGVNLLKEPVNRFRFTFGDDHFVMVEEWATEQVLVKDYVTW